MNDRTENEEKMIQKMRALQNVPERDPKKITTGRAAFLTRAAELRQSMPEQTSRRLSWFGSLFTAPGKKLGALPTILIVLALLFGGSGVSVVAAQSANPQDLLYPVKIKSEDIAYNFKPGPQAVFDYCLQLTDRRISEIVYSAESKKPLPAVTSDRLLAHIDEAVSYTAKMSDADMLNSLVQLQDQLRIQLQTMEKLQADDQSMNAIKEVLALVQARISTIAKNSGDIKQFRLQIQNGSYEAEIEIEKSEYEHQFQLDNQKKQEDDRNGSGSKIEGNGSKGSDDLDGNNSDNQSDGEKHGKNSSTVTPDLSDNSGSDKISGSSTKSGSHSGSGKSDDTPEPDNQTTED